MLDLPMMYLTSHVSYDVLVCNQMSSVILIEMGADSEFLLIYWQLALHCNEINKMFRYCTKEFELLDCSCILCCHFRY